MIFSQLLKYFIQFSSDLYFPLRSGSCSFEGTTLLLFRVSPHFSSLYHDVLSMVSVVSIILLIVHIALNLWFGV